MITQLPGQEHRDPSEARGRALALGIIVVLAFSVVGIRLYQLQIRSGSEFRLKSLNNFFQTKRIEHERGEIVDASGVVLVTNRQAVNVYVTPAFLPDARRAVRTLARAIGLSRKEADEKLLALGQVAAQHGPPILLLDGASASAIARLHEARASLDLPNKAVAVLRRGPRRYAVYLDSRYFPTTTLVLERLHALARLDRRSFEQLERRVRLTRGLKRYQQILVRRDVSPEIEAPLLSEVQLGRLPGVTVRRASAREYRFGRTAGHALGYVNQLSPRDLDVLRERGYRLGDSIGRAGVERAYEDELRGTDGAETVVVDAKGRLQRGRLADVLRAEVGERVAAIPGHRVVLNLDVRLQQVAESAFDGIAGSVVVMEVNTGRLLALTSTPSYDPNRLSDYFDPEERALLKSLRQRRPWRFRAIQDYFAPGSTFKIVTALAALEEKAVRSTERVSCPGSFVLGDARFRCWKEHGHGAMNLSDSLKHSCDVFYYNMGRRLGLNPIASVGRRMGFGQPTGVDLPSESRGIMPDERWYDKNLPEGYTLGAAVNASIGQGAVVATPLQLAVAYAALANGGTVLEPRIARRIERWDGELLRRIEPRVRGQVELDPEAMALVRDGLRRVVNEPGGTAYGKRLRDLVVAGKTGTAQVARLGQDRRSSRKADWRLRDHAWFVAYAPADDPKVVVVVFNEHGGGGSSTAAPIAMKVVKAWNDLYGEAVAAVGP
ncbi:MAG: penicillin-binding protein 2 [Myxococcota bacterium]